MSGVKVTDNSKQVLDAFENKLQNALWAIGATIFPARAEVSPALINAVKRLVLF